MRIFILLSRVPYPLEKGDKLRAYHQIRELSRKNEIILCALNPDKKLNKQKAFAALQPFCRSINFIDIPFYRKLWNIGMAFFNGLPFQTGYFYNKSASRKVNKLIAEYKPEHIYCQLLRTAEYVKETKIPKTLDYQDVFSYGMKRRLEHASLLMKPLLKMEYQRLARYEEKIFKFFENKTIISIPDRNLIPHPEREKIEVIPNGVDWEYFSPLKKEKSFDLIFIGNMAYPPNIDAAEFLAKEIMPLVWKKIPEAILLLAGASPHLRVSSLYSERIKVSGWLDDIREAYSSGKIFIAPMRIGTGLQNKLLEAMAMKIPCITTPLANDALQAENGKQILIGSSAGELAECVLKLLENENLYNELAVNGQQLVRKQFSWEEYTEKLHKIINGIDS
jgi:glycosyltransferase involved in cell wall biosynthesis